MKVLKFKSESETEKMIVRLTLKGKKFQTTGRREIVVL